MVASPVTPTVGQVVTIAVGGTAEQVFPAGIAGGLITNPSGAAGVLYVNPLNSATLIPTGTTFALQPGQSWTAIPGQTTPTTVNAADNGHAFSAVYWL